MELGKTTDRGDRYITWYPDPESSSVYVRFLLLRVNGNPEIAIDSNLTAAESMKLDKEEF